MRLCFLYSNHHLADLTAQPGVAFKLATVAAACEHQVLIVSNAPQLPESIPKGIRFCLFPGLGDLSTYVRHLGQLIREINDFQPEVIHVHGDLYFVFLCFLQPFIRRPITIYVSEVLAIHSGITRWFFLVCLRLAGQVFVSSDHIGKELLAGGVSSEKIFTVRLGLDQKYLRAERPKKSSLDVLYFGDSTVSRGFDLVVRTAERLKQYRFICLLRYPKTDCPEILEIAAKCKNLELKYFPYQENLEKILAKSQIVLLPFRTMGVRPPITIVEAMAVGACVVTSKLPGTEEIVKHGSNGLILDNLSLDEIGTTLKALLKNRLKLQRIGSAARRQIKLIYSPLNYQEILARIEGIIT